MPGEEGKIVAWPYVAAVVGAIIVLLGLTAWRPSVFSPGLTVPLVVALFGLGGIVMQIAVGQRAEAARRRHEIRMAHSNALAEARMQTFDERKDVYEHLIKPFRNLLMANVEGFQPDGQGILDPAGMAKAKFDLLYYGSDETVNSLIEFFALASKEPTDDADIIRKREAANLVFFARLIRSVRQDLGLETGSLDEIALLRLVVTDLAAHETRMREAMRWANAGEVP